MAATCFFLTLDRFSSFITATSEIDRIASLVFKGFGSDWGGLVEVVMVTNNYQLFREDREREKDLFDAWTIPTGKRFPFFFQKYKGDEKLKHQTKCCCFLQFLSFWASFLWQVNGWIGDGVDSKESFPSNVSLLSDSSEDRLFVFNLFNTYNSLIWIAFVERNMEQLRVQVLFLLLSAIFINNLQLGLYR